jgi:hypothetical protein
MNALLKLLLAGQKSSCSTGEAPCLNHSRGPFEAESFRRNYLPVPITCAVVLCVHAAWPVSATPVSLLLPQSTAFSFLGHSCGGIQEHAYAIGFDPATSYPTGAVYIQTRCGGSGRGGGYHVTTYSAWVGASWDFTGKLLSATRLTNVPPVSTTFTATDANGDQLYNTTTAAYLTVPVPGAPTKVTAFQTSDQFEVAWSPAVAIDAVITSSTITATPVGSTAPILTNTVSGTNATGLIGPLQPQTTYAITVVNTTIGGSSPPSTPIDVKTVPASVVPQAPTSVTAVWGGANDTTGTIFVNWHASIGGDSPVDQYQITINGSDGGGTFTQTVPGTVLTASFTVSDIPDWSVTVRAHNAAGWSAWSARTTLGGL